MILTVHLNLNMSGIRYFLIQNVKTIVRTFWKNMNITPTSNTEHAATVTWDDFKQNWKSFKENFKRVEEDASWVHFILYLNFWNEGYKIYQ